MTSECAWPTEVTEEDAHYTCSEIKSFVLVLESSHYNFTERKIKLLQNSKNSYLKFENDRAHCSSYLQAIRLLPLAPFSGGKNISTFD